MYWIAGLLIVCAWVMIIHIEFRVRQMEKLLEDKGLKPMGRY